MLSSTTILVVLALAGGASAYSDCDFEDMCDRRCKEVNQLSHVKALNLREPAWSDSFCDARKKAARSLVSVLIENDQKNICRDVAGKTLEYLARREFKEFSVGTLPKALVGVTKAVAFETSAKCKIHMLKHLPAAQALLTPQQLEPIERLEKAKVFLLDDKVAPVQGDLFNYAAQLSHMIGLEDVYRRKLHGEPLKQSTIDFLETFRKECVLSYAPIYETLISTLLRLARVDLTYVKNGALAKDVRKQINEDKNVRRWLNVFLVCQSTVDSEIFENRAIYPDAKMALDDSQFASPQLPDEVLVKRRDFKPLETAADRASKEATIWRKTIYKQIVGTEHPDENYQVRGSFWEAYMRQIDSVF